MQTNYVADAMGYRVESNDLPVAPMDVPAPVQDTPEVAEAKAKFFQVFEETKSRARRSVPVQTPASTVPLTSAVMTPLATRTVVPNIAPVSFSNVAPLAYSSPFAYSTPFSYSTPYPYSTPYSSPYSYGYPYYTGVF